MITCNEKKVDVQEPISGTDLVKKLNLLDPSQGLGLRINGVLKDFTETIRPGDTVEIYSFDTKEGKEIFWHTSAHILAQAILRLYPDAVPTIGPAIESGFYYDFANLHLSEKDFPVVEKEIKKIIKENFKPCRSEFVSKEVALSTFKDNPFKCELINQFEDGPITAYKQGEFFDLCRGPHLPTLGKVKAFKVMRTSAAYWKGDSNRESLTRVYGISFPDKAMLEAHLTLLEEAKKRDHRKLGAQLDLFSFLQEAPGMPLIHPKGMIIWNRLLEFWRSLHEKEGYEEIKTPIMMDQSLWEKSGHWENYRENMYISEIEKHTFAIKPMNCPAGMLFFKSQQHSYRDLPRRVGEIGLVHRDEHSGSLTGFLRVRAFHQDDAHIFMKPSDIKSEILEVLKLADTIYKTFGLTYRLELSTRPEKSIGTDKDWEMTTEALRSALDAWGSPYSINPGDGAFYGPKIDIHVEDALGRAWQCGTVQLDMSLPLRFDLRYTDQDGKEKQPIMIHRALYGSIERFFAIIIEHFEGKFPLWISPRGVRIIPVADRHVDFAKKLQAKVRETGISTELDQTNESVSKKIVLAQMDKVNYMFIIGDKEVENKTISIRLRDGNQINDLHLEEFLTKVTKEIKTKSLHPSW